MKNTVHILDALPLLSDKELVERLPLETRSFKWLQENTVVACPREKVAPVARS